MMYLVSDTTNYNTFLARLQNSAQYGNIEAVLFYQGESDTLTYDDAVNWCDRFEQFVTDLRDDLDMPDLPVIFAQVGTFKTPTAYHDELQARQAAFSMDGVSMVPTYDLPLWDDPNNNVHLSAEGEYILGQRFSGAL